MVEKKQKKSLGMIEDLNLQNMIHLTIAPFILVMVITVTLGVINEHKIWDENVLFGAQGIFWMAYFTNMFALWTTKFKSDFAVLFQLIALLSLFGGIFAIWVLAKGVGFI